MSALRPDLIVARNTRDIWLQPSAPIQLLRQAEPAARVLKNGPMRDFEPITPAEFCGAVFSQASPVLAREWDRYTVSNPFSWDPDCSVVHRGSVSATSFRAPEFNTLILGDLNVEGLLDLSAGYEQGAGTFVVLGNVTCRDMIGERCDQVFVDGDLSVPGLLLNAFPDSSLTVAGSIKTRFFYGWDTWGTVGRGADMDYGDCYCLPIGYADAESEAIRPRHDSRRSRELLVVDELRDDVSRELATLLRGRQSVFRD